MAGEALVWKGGRDVRMDRVASNLERTGRTALNWARRDKGLQRARLGTGLMATGVDLEEAGVWGKRLWREGRGRVTGQCVAFGDHGCVRGAVQARENSRKAGERQPQTYRVGKTYRESEF